MQTFSGGGGGNSENLYGAKKEDPCKLDPMTETRE